jgi:hypothetical protein
MHKEMAKKWFAVSAGLFFVGVVILAPLSLAVMLFTSVPAEATFVVLGLWGTLSLLLGALSVVEF